MLFVHLNVSKRLITSTPPCIYLYDSRIKFISCDHCWINAYEIIARDPISHHILLSRVQYTCTFTYPGHFAHNALFALSKNSNIALRFRNSPQWDHTEWPLCLPRDTKVVSLFIFIVLFCNDYAVDKSGQTPLVCLEMVQFYILYMYTCVRTPYCNILNARIYDVWVRILFIVAKLTLVLHAVISDKFPTSQTRLWFTRLLKLQ